MIAALLKSTKPSLSSWVFLGGRGKVRVVGMDGDKVLIFARPGDLREFEILKNGVYQLPKEVIAIRVEHLKASGSPVSVDIV